MLQASRDSEQDLSASSELNCKGRWASVDQSKTLSFWTLRHSSASNISTRSLISFCYSTYPCLINNRRFDNIDTAIDHGTLKFGEYISYEIELISKNNTRLDWIFVDALDNIYICNALIFKRKSCELDT